jgi:hypothetical protein
MKLCSEQINETTFENIEMSIERPISTDQKLLPESYFNENMMESV